MTDFNLIPIESADDARVAPYTNLKERDLAREGGRFIAEGEHVVRRLLESEYAVESLLVAEDRLSRIGPRIPPGTTVYVAPHPVVHRIVGFKFHSGIMACGLRGPRRSLQDVAQTWADQPVTVVVLPEISNTENLGSLIRISSAFGVDALLLGELCCDPFYRQSIRVSMGNVFALPIVESADLMADLKELRERWGVQRIGSVVGGDTEPLGRATRPDRIAVLFGNEAQGLGPRQIEVCDRRVTIPMGLGTDSLNVAVAAGIFLYHFTQYAKKA